MGGCGSESGKGRYTTRLMSSDVAVIFDLDGTLADTLDGIVDAMNHVLARRGFPVHERDAYRRFIGNGVHALVERALPADQRHLADQVLAEYLPVLIERGGDAAKPYAESAAVLDGLVQRGIRFAVLSNKPADATRDVVQRLFASYDFVEVRGQVDGTAIKPDPTVALELAAAMNVPPQRCAFVGDSDVDMQTARNAGMYAVGAGWGIRGEAELRASGAAVVLQSPGELLAVVDRPWSGAPPS